MIRIGDTVDLKDSLDMGRRGTRGKQHFKNLIKENGFEVPFEVTSIKDCGSVNCHREECPGYVNGECFGYTEGYILEPVRQEWDRKYNIEPQKEAKDTRWDV